MLRRIVRRIAMQTGQIHALYVKLCQPDGMEYAQYLRRWGDYRSIGDECSIPTYANVTNPYLTSLGNNVRLSQCTIFGHDGSVNMIRRVFGKPVDKVGPVRLLDNVFIGHGAIVLPGVTVGPNAIVGAGAVVARDVPRDSVVAGNPARVVASLSEYAAKLAAQTEALPWYALIAQRNADFDRALEPELRRQRIEHYFPGTAESD